MPEGPYRQTRREKEGITNIGDTVTAYAPALLRADGSIAGLELRCSPDWEPTADWLPSAPRKRGLCVALVRSTRTVRDLERRRLPGGESVHVVPQYSAPELEILRMWQWTGRQWIVKG